MSNKIWKVKETPTLQQIQNLQTELNIPTTFAKILVQRDIQNFEQARAFFRPDWSLINDPFLMMNMDRAVKRINQAFINKERIMLFGDYDVDGTTAVAVMWTVLHFSFNCSRKDFLKNAAYGESR